MATTTAAAAGGSYEGGAGGGGKFQKKPLRFNRTTKPYERPITAIRNPIEAGTGNGWISRIVDPAKRLIAKSAQNFYSSVFRKNLPAPPPPSPVTETNHEQRVQFREANPYVPSSESHERTTGNEGVRLNNSPGDNGIDILEKLFKEKTFTKAEIERLTEVMHSRTVDGSTENGMETSRPSTSQRATAQQTQEVLHMAVQQNGLVSQNLGRGVSTPFRSSAIEQDVTSPTEVAKAYMGNRPSKVSPSTLGLRSQSLREDVALLTNAPFTPKSHSMSLVPRSAVRFPAVSENGFLTPRPRGRSAIYNMARTPYSRVHNSGVLKIDAQSTPSTSSQGPWENNTFSGGKQPSKRRISVFDSDIGSGGAIRRIRQKTNMLMSPSKAMITPGSSSSNPVAAGGSYAAQGSTSSAQKYLLDQSKHGDISNLEHSENGRNSNPATNLGSVPSQSTQMAQKILQQLDKLVPSPKQKSSEVRLASARGKSPAKLTLGMLQGQALRSVEDADSSRFLVTAQSSGALDGAGGNASGAEASTSRKQKKVKENSHAEGFAFGDEKAPKAKSLETKSSIQDTVLNGKVSDMPPQKRAFQMSAHEDYLDMDDDSYDEKVNLTPVVSESEKLSATTAQSTSSAAETVAVVNPLISSSETRTVNAILNGADRGASDMPVTPAPTTLVESTPVSQPISSVEKSELKGETPFAFSFASPANNQTSAVESPGVVSGAQSTKKMDTPNSTGALTVSEAEHAPKAAESGETKELTHKAPFTFGAPTSSSLNNGLSASTTSLCPAPTTALDSSKGLVTSSGTSSTSVVAPTAITNPSNSASSNNSMSTLPAITAAPFQFSVTSTLPATTAAPFQFGLSSTPAVVPSTAAPLPSSNSEDKDLESKTKQPPPFGILTSTGDTPSTLTSPGDGGTFGFKASGAVNPFANNKSQTPNHFAPAAGSSVISAKTDTTEPGGGTAPSTNSTQSPYGSSAPSSTSGFSGSTAVSSIGSVTAAANPFGSVTAAANPFGSVTAAANPFGSSGFTFGASSGSSSGGFTFGAKTSAGSAPFGLTTSVGSSAQGSSPFSFTSAAAGTASLNSVSQTVSGFGTTNMSGFGTANTSGFGTTSPTNDQMNMEDSMAEDVVQAPAPLVPAFGQPAGSTSPFMFGQPASSPLPSAGSPFMFGGQQNPATQMSNPFPAQPPTGDFGGLGGTTGSFSLGSTGGGDKSGRKIVKVRRDKLRKR